MVSLGPGIPALSADVALPAAPSTKPTVLVFARALMPGSQTFVLDHVRSLDRYHPILIGIERVDGGLPLDDVDARVLLDNRSLIGRIAFAMGFNAAFDRLVAEVRPALLHAHFVTDALHILPLARRHKIPLVVTAHGYDVSIDPRALPKLDRLLYATRLRALSRHAARLIAVSELVREFALERGFVASRTTTHLLGIDRQRFQVPAVPVAGRILFVGRLVEKKGIAFLLRAADVLKRQGVRFDLRIVGGGPMRAELESLAARLAVPVTFVGPLDRAGVAAELAQAWLFSMPSVRAADGDSEGLPIVFLEAQAVGVPVIAFDNESAREAVSNGCTGLLARAGDVDDLARCLGKVIGDARLRSQLSAAAVAWVAMRFDLRSNTRGLETIYDAVARPYRSLD